MSRSPRAGICFAEDPETQPSRVINGACLDRLTIEELVRSCQRVSPSDTRAFETLVSRTKQLVFSVTYRLMGNQQEAEDQAQEVFIKVYKNIKTLDNPALFLSWVTRVATNTCLDALAKQQRRPKTTSLTPTDSSGEEESVQYADTRILTPEETALRNEMQRCMQQTLAQMDATSRAVLVLRDIEDRSYQEIADALSLGMSAVKMRIHRARVAFQKILDNVCPDVARAVQTSPNQ